MLLSVLACSTPVYDIAGVRQIAVDGPPIEVLDRAACAKTASPETCGFVADRSKGRVHFSFARGPVRVDEVRVTFDGALQQAIEVVPQEPVDGRQLSILVVDEGLKPDHRTLLAGVLREQAPRLLARGGALVWVTAGATLTASPVITDLAALGALLDGFVASEPTSVGGLHSLAGLGSLLDTPAISAAGKGARHGILLVSDGFHDDPAKPTCQEGVPRLKAAIDAVAHAREGRDLVVDTLGLGTPYRKHDPEAELDGLCGEYGESTTVELGQNGVDHVTLDLLARVGGGRSHVRRKAAGITEVFEWVTAPRYARFEVDVTLPDPSLWTGSGFRLGLEHGGAQAEVDVGPQ